MKRRNYNVLDPPQARSSLSLREERAGESRREGLSELTNLLPPTLFSLGGRRDFFEKDLAH
jgi:hypothetical protein